MVDSPPSRDDPGERGRYAPTVLYVDPDDDRRATAVAAVRDAGDPVEVVTATTTDDATEDLTADGVVVAHDPPAVDAAALLDAVERERPDVPVIVRLSPAAIESLGERLFAATDYYLLDAGSDAAVADRITAAVSDRDWADIVDRMTDAFFALDESWHLTYVNRAAARILGPAMGDPDADRSELEGRQFWESIPDAVDTVFYEAYTAAMENQESRTLTEYYEPLDAWFDVTVYPSATGLSVYLADVTDRQRQREQLERRERVLRDIYTAIADSDQSFEAQVQRLLEIGCDALGVSYGTLSRIEGEEYVFEVVEAPPDTLSAGDTVPLSATNCERTVTTERTVVLADIEREAPDLAERAGYTEMGISCYIGAPVVVEGDIYGTFCFYDDEPRSEPFSAWETTLVDLLGKWVSYELDRTQTHRDLQAQNERLEQFASIVSHDLRNPLDVAINRLDLIETTDADAENVAAIQRSHERMVALIDDLLLLAREGKASADPSPVALEQVARWAWEQVDTGDATLTVSTDRRVLADPSYLQRILENLFRNSLEHGRPDGDTPLALTVGDTENGFFVADDGRGIDDADREAVFESGYTSGADSTGLGLAIVERLATAHGWSVDVTDAEGGGARFAFGGVRFHDDG
jgi:GAF domain-containing protein